MAQETNRWEKARLELIKRWQGVLGKIHEQDEGGVLQLASVMDEFCEEADSTLHEAGSHAAVPDPEQRITPPGGTRPVGERCLFCRGFMELGGCYGTLDRLNRAVFDHKWDEARRVAEEYIARLQELSPAALGNPSLPLAD